MTLSDRGGSARPLLVAAVVEPVSLLILLVNLATLQIDAVASVVGPVHGTAYLVAIASTSMGEYPTRARVWAWLPGLGALLAMRSAAPKGHAAAEPGIDATPASE